MGLCLILLPLHLSVGQIPSAFLVGSTLLLLLLMMLFELGSHRRELWRVGESISFALAITSITTITFAETPSRSVSIFFLVVPLQAAILVQGISTGWRWLLLALTEYFLAVLTEMILSSGTGHWLATLGNILVRVLFLCVFFVIASEVRRPINDAMIKIERGADQLRTTNQALERALRVRSEFLANMSHEIRTPLNAVIGSTDLLLNSSITSEQRDFIQTIQDSGNGLLVILNDILDLARLESGKMLIEKIQFPLRSLLFDALDLVAMRAAERGIDLMGEVSLDTPFVLEGDPIRLRQIILNLLANAIKFTEQGQVILKTSVIREQAPRLRIVVEDSGIGLRPEALARLFQPFYQNDATIHRIHGGTGLGLAICQRLVQLLGGRIGAESKLGVGSTFWIELPLVNASIGSGNPIPWLAGNVVWVIDPSPSLRRSLASLLGVYFIEKCGEASSIEEALGQVDVVGEPRPVLVLIGDQALDDSSSLERLQGVLPEAKFFLLSPLGEMDVLVPPRFHGVLSKPVRPERLQRSLLTMQSLSIFSAAISTISRSEARILLVEDNPINQRILMRMVQKLGYICELASSGEEVLTICERDTFDLILMDIRLPGMDGSEVTRHLRAREGLRRHTIIIAVTANAFSEDRENCLASGMDDFLAKPVRIQDLQGMLTRWLKRPGTTSRDFSISVH